jgi:branched-subunit amino acid aminotransferase/4-amino-4-deoxychorismate lyase
VSDLLAVAVAGRGLVDPAQPVFRADDEALLRGSAAFETLRVYAGRPFMLDRHLDRMRVSIAGLALPPLDEDAGELVRLAVDAADPDCVLRLYRTSETFVALTSRLPPPVESLRLRTLDVGVPPPLLSGVKSTSYALPLAGRRDAQAHGADDVVFRNGDALLECATANLWLRRGGLLVTPALGPRVLPGITREVVASLAPAAGYAVVETTVTLADVAASDEAFTSSSIVELVPVTAIDDVEIARGEAAPALLTALREAALG